MAEGKKREAGRVTRRGGGSLSIRFGKTGRVWEQWVGVRGEVGGTAGEKGTRKVGGRGWKTKHHHRRQQQQQQQSAPPDIPSDKSNQDFHFPCLQPKFYFCFRTDNCILDEIFLTTFSPSSRQSAHPPVCRPPKVLRRRSEGSAGARTQGRIFDIEPIHEYIRFSSGALYDILF